MLPQVPTGVLIDKVTSMKSLKIALCERKI